MWEDSKEDLAVYQLKKMLADTVAKRQVSIGFEESSGQPDAPILRMTPVGAGQVHERKSVPLA